MRDSLVIGSSRGEASWLSSKEGPPLDTNSILCSLMRDKDHTNSSARCLPKVHRLGAPRRDRGFTLIELLIVVTIIGVIAAIAVPNLLSAVNRGRQKRTMADLRTIGHAMESYTVDYGNYPGITSLSTGIAGTAGDFEPFLCPTYIKKLPSIDGWGGEYQMVTGHYVESRLPGYVIVSFGRDGVYDGSVPPDGETVFTSDFNADIVYGNGSFWKRPTRSQGE